MIDNEITERILKAAFKVHSKLGPGLLESSYKACLSYEMIQNGLFVEVEKTNAANLSGSKIRCRIPIGFIGRKKSCN